jgi:hypothetical protein
MGIVCAIQITTLSRTGFLKLAIQGANIITGSLVELSSHQYYSIVDKAATGPDQPEEQGSLP